MITRRELLVAEEVYKMEMFLAETKYKSIAVQYLLDKGWTQYAGILWRNNYTEGRLLEEALAYQWNEEEMEDD